jgi:putative ABC transport system permease protein
MDAVVGRARRGLLLLLGAIGAVLLIACANLANLTLTRSLSRMRDAAVRTALGASRSRLVSQVVVEQVMLAAIGGAFGLSVAQVLLAAFVRTTPLGDLPRMTEIALDGRVLLFAGLASIGAGLFVSILPAWRLAGRDLERVLRATGPATTSGRSGLRARAALLTAQVALSVTLLVVTMLMTVSFVRLLRVEPGFAADHVLAVDVTLPGIRYSAPQLRVGVYGRILSAVSVLPGVDSAAWTSNLPLTGESWVDAILPAGLPEVTRDVPVANYRFVAPQFFRVLSVPISAGRSLGEADLDTSGATTAAVISRRTAERMWPGLDPIGRRFTRGNTAEKPFEVVGVCADGYPSRLDVPPPMMVYVPYSYRSRTRASLVIRSGGDLSSLTAVLRKTIWDLDPEIAIANARPMEQVVDAAVGGRRYQATLFIGFGAVAILIAALGVYAVTAYGVSRRRREMNIRVALGAERRQVIRLMVRDAFSPVAAGLGVGTVGALALGPIVASLLFGIGARNPLVITVVVAIVGGIALLACLIAVRQGLLLHPAAALREE